VVHLLAGTKGAGLGSTTGRGSGVFQADQRQRSLRRRPDRQGIRAQGALGRLSAPATLPDSFRRQRPAARRATARERPCARIPWRSGLRRRLRCPLVPPETPEPRPCRRAHAGLFVPARQVDHFEIVSLIARAAWAAVYKAFDRDSAAPWPSRPCTASTSSVQHTGAFPARGPGRLTRGPSQPVIIYSYGAQGETPYIVMEYLSGRSLGAETPGPTLRRAHRRRSGRGLRRRGMPPIALTCPPRSQGRATSSRAHAHGRDAQDPAIRYLARGRRRRHT